MVENRQTFSNTWLAPWSRGAPNCASDSGQMPEDGAWGETNFRSCHVPKAE